MNKQTATLLERHFDTAFDSADGVKKLRELILTLAMQGKLVKQDPKDEPASELLKTIQAEKVRLVKEGKIKAQKELEEIKAGDVPYELPVGWEWVRLIDIGTWAIGSGLPHSIQGDTTQEIMLCKVSDMNLFGNEKFIVSSNNTVSEEIIQQERLNVSQPGTIIFPKIGGAIATNKRRILKERTVIDNNCLGITPASVMNLEWVYQLLLKFDFSKYQSGTSVPAISQGTIGMLTIGLPPLAEQHRIVAKIDQLMARCDELEKLRTQREQMRITVHATAIKQLLDAETRDDQTRSWEFITRNFGELYRVKENVSELRKAILQLAVMGKLVKQDPSDQPASELLKEIEAEKARLIKEKKIKPSKPLPEIKADEVPYKLPTGWEWVRLGEVFNTTSGNTFDASLEKDNGDFAYVKVGDMNLPANKLVITTSSRFINPNEKMKGWLIPKGSIIFPKRGGAIATNKKRIVDKPIFVDLNTMAITPIMNITTNYAYLWLSTVDLATLNTGTSVPQINHKDIDPLSFPLPPLAEQHRIVAKIDKLMALCDTLDQHIESTNSKQNELLQSITAS